MWDNEKQESEADLGGLAIPSASDHGKWTIRTSSANPSEEREKGALRCVSQAAIRQFFVKC
jgi:hypothetical protein